MLRADHDEIWQPAQSTAGAGNVPRGLDRPVNALTITPVIFAQSDKWSSEDPRGKRAVLNRKRMPCNVLASKGVSMKNANVPFKASCTPHSVPPSRGISSQDTTIVADKVRFEQTATRTDWSIANEQNDGAEFY